PVQQGVHVPLVGRLRIDGERAEARLRGFGLHHRELDMSEAHPAPLLGHVRQPQPSLLRRLAHLDDALDELLAVVAIPSLLDGSHHLVDERAYAVADVLELGREAEIDGHGRQSTVRLTGWSSLGCDRPPGGSIAPWQDDSTARLR